MSSALIVKSSYKSLQNIQIDDKKSIIVIKVMLCYNIPINKYKLIYRKVNIDEKNQVCSASHSTFSISIGS